ncbi:DUF3243 domain-containing protein [Metallumcola ferriviriculae]|uniref:DUF3243 domain-containing protein n=1 Tax=Metallumcola ferriviriculae TaxID=3039180 RepID=A0AAU0UTV0_9FIRM|nr:DUF3243 domain-containing protein [Desulfitibacteraceae bacterium MK1]
MQEQLKGMLSQLDASSWENWKKSLGNMVQQAKKSGINQDTLVEFAAEFGDFLTHNISPDVPENIALKELWQAANEEEQKTLAKLMLKLTH